MVPIENNENSRTAVVTLGDFYAYIKQTTYMCFQRLPENIVSGALHRRSTFADICHDSTQNHKQFYFIQ